jgi:hypothetical protein
MKCMRQYLKTGARVRCNFVGVALVALLATAAARADGPSPEATAAFNANVAKLESKLAQEHRSADVFMQMPPDPGKLRQGELSIEELTPEGGKEIKGAMLHHWRGTAFAPGASAPDFERLMRDYNRYPQLYAPQVISARVLNHNGDHYQVMLRVRQKHVITVVLDTSYDVTFGKLDARHGFSISRSTKISEIEDEGTPHERALGENDSHGFLWRMNTYWTYEERDGGVYMQVESISMSRSIPTGLGWAVGPFVKSVPRESLEFTLRATRNALRK